MHIVRQVVEAARQTERWDLRRFVVRCLRLLRVLLNPRRHREVGRRLAIDRLREVYPRTPFKYLGSYLARSLSVAERAAILANHYAYLQRRLLPAALGEILFGCVRLWEIRQASLCAGIRLTFSHPVDREGELSLVLHADDTEIFVLSFTVSPGAALGIAAEQAFLVSRLQGRRGCFEAVRRATKSLADISPPAVLMAALQGIAASLGIRDVVGIAAREQVALTQRAPTAELVSAYDDFWDSLGARRLDERFFHLAMPLPEKPLALIKQNHRSRTIDKRRLKRQIAEQIRREFDRHVS